jgi:hypothetical protein
MYEGEPGLDGPAGTPTEDRDEVGDASGGKNGAGAENTRPGRTSLPCSSSAASSVGRGR